MLISGRSGEGWSVGSTGFVGRCMRDYSMDELEGLGMLGEQRAEKVDRQATWSSGMCGLWLSRVSSQVQDWEYSNNWGERPGGDGLWDP